MPKSSFFPNIPFTFLLFKALAFLQIFFPRNLLFRQVLRMSVFLNGKCLKTSNKRTHSFIYEAVYVAIGNQAFCLFLYLTGMHFRGKLQHIGDVSEQKIKCLTNQNSRNRWCQIVRWTICY